MRYCEDGAAFNYEDPILSKECNCDEIATHYDSRYSKYAKKDENPKSEAPTDTSSIYQGSNDSKGTSSEKHLDTQDSAIKPQGSRIEPQDSKIESQYTAIEETQESTTEPQESTTIIYHDESDEKDYPKSEAPTDNSSLYQGFNDSKGTTSEKHLDLQDSIIEPQYMAIQHTQESTTESQDSMIDSRESTSDSHESTTEYQDPTELQPVLTEGPILMNKNYDKNIDRIVKAVLKKLELNHTAIEEPKESTIEPQESTTESQESTSEPQESTTEPQDPTELEPVLTQGPILMSKNKNNIIDTIVKAVLKTVEWKHVSIEELQESTTDPHDPTQLQSAVAAVLKKLELNNSGV